MDTQDIVLWGKVRPEMTWNELARIRELCKWGEQFGLDGFVRYWFDYFLHLAASLTGIFLQDVNGLVSITLLVGNTSQLINEISPYAAKSWYATSRMLGRSSYRSPKSFPMTAIPSIRDHHVVLLRRCHQVGGGECVPAYRMRSRPQTRGVARSIAWRNTGRDRLLPCRIIFRSSTLQPG